MTTREQNLSTSQIVRGDNDRTVFDPAALQELASSIKTYGLAQPIVVRPVSGTVYQIVAGERRFRAVSQVLGWTEIPAIVRDLSDEQASGIMLAENVARADLDPVDEALAYDKRISEFGWTVAEVAERAGVSAVRVRFRLKLLALRSDVRRLVRGGHIQLGYAQILADGQLDHNRQLIALSRLRDNPSPTPTWFRREVGGLVEEQNQDSLFDTATFFVEQVIDSAPSSRYVEPPTPATASPTFKANAPVEALALAVEFWTRAAGEWEKLGKTFKRQECEAAALALKQVAATM